MSSHSNVLCTSLVKLHYSIVLLHSFHHFNVFLRTFHPMFHCICMYVMSGLLLSDLNKETTCLLTYLQQNNNSTDNVQVLVSRYSLWRSIFRQPDSWNSWGCRESEGDSCGTHSDGPSSVNQTVGTLEVAVRVKLGDSCGTYSNGPSSVNQTVGTLEVAVRVKVTLVQVFHSFGDVSHQRQLKSVVQLDFVVHQYVLYQWCADS